jgi:excinuclease ABC subunit A
MKNKITIKGAREHNLKNVSLELPRNELICFTGLSGSGKSSLAFDTIFAEGQRRYIESLSAYARQFLGQMQKPDVDEIEGLSPAISIDQKAHSRNPRSTVATVTEIYDYLRVLYARTGVPHCPETGVPLQKLTVDEMVDRILGQAKDRYKEKKSITILAPTVQGRKGEYYQLLYDLYNSGFAKVRVDGKMHRLSEKIKLSRYKKHTIEVVIDAIPAKMLVDPDKDSQQRLSEALERAIEIGHDFAVVQFADGEEQMLSATLTSPATGKAFPSIEPRLFSFNSPYGACQSCDGLGTEELYSDEVCTACEGKRLRPEALAVTVMDKNIVQVAEMTIQEAAEFVINMDLDERTLEIAGTVLKEVENRLTFMLDVGLHYLTLNRKAGTLSGGEAQRIRLASQIGSRLVGALYVLDEPTIGLHQRDNEQLVKTLENLRDIGNTVIVVEHDEDTIRASDYLVEIGPGAGVHGGEIVAAGKTADFLKNKKSNTAAYLNGTKKIAIPRERRKPGRDAIKVKGASENNLKNINVDIPLRRFICITGVSGSGKSSLMHEVVYKTIAKRLNGAKAKPGAVKSILGVEYIDKCILMNQNAIGRSSRSNPATYTGAWTPVREIFAATAEAKFRGYKVGRFSFNVPGGRCDNCDGHGENAIEMHFLPTVYVTCDVCRGKRFNRETLEVLWNGKNISQVLNMTIEVAVEFFKDVPAIFSKLVTLNEVGLGYLTLGQSANTLSGGEAQRVKLAAELSKRSTGRTLYLLDEPTTGLHFEDIQKLLDVLHRLVEKGNTVIVIEHNLDVIKTADWIIDIGPEGGAGGGQIVVDGTPEQVAVKAGSYTGKYLRAKLKE